MSYDLVPLAAPRLTGRALRAVARLLESGLLGAPLARKLLRDNGILGLRSIPAKEPFSLGPRLPLLEPTDPLEAPPAAGTILEQAEALPAPRGTSTSRFTTVTDFATSYRDGAVSPETVVDRLIAFVRESEQSAPPMRFFINIDEEDIRRQAKESADRLRAGKPRGPLEGVPLAVKDELDQQGYPTTLGTRCRGSKIAHEDATVVARLRAAGAIMLGKTNMHEMGLGVTGINPHHGPARNPYDPTRVTGGSSSGSAAVVAAGLCPIAIGADGGGSIRIPAGFCGVVGLKATRGRMSEHGVVPLCWSVAHVGPIGATVRDTALAYALLAGSDEADHITAGQPPPTLAGVGDEDLDGLRIGVFPPWFDDADQEVRETCHGALDKLQERGAELVEVAIPELKLLRTVHLVTIVCEMAASLASRPEIVRTKLAGDTRLSLALSERLRGSDYIHAQRHRARLEEHFEALLGSRAAPRQAPVDVLATPMSGCLPPVIRAQALASGESDIALLDRIMRFAQPANITGLPALSVPVGSSATGLPIGLQLMGRAWDEALLLRLALALETTWERRTPPVYCRLLED